MNIRIFFSFFLLSVNNIFAQSIIKVQHLEEATLPGGITFSENFSKAVKWNQHDTIHYVVLSETDLSSQAHHTGRSACLQASHYSGINDSLKLEWIVKDGIGDCEVDYHAYFLPKTFSITDIDRDGTPEVWLMYSTACRGDVSPATLKIIMYEGVMKHAMRGRTLVNYSANERDGGEYTFDAAFANAPVAIRNYAQQLWKKYREEKW